MATILERIRVKVRRLTRSPSSTNITDAEIDQYVNDFFTYDFPEHLRSWALRESFTFVRQPNIDRYTTDANANVTGLVNFQQNYINVEQPLYIAGNPSYYSEDRTEFFSMFPQNQSIQNIGIGDGTLAQNFSGTINNKPILQRSVLFSTTGNNNESISATDSPVDVEFGDLVDSDSGLTIGGIGYLTGQYTVSFNAGNQSKVVAQYFNYAPGRPNALLYFDNTFYLRPVPDRSYEISFEVYKRPDELLNSNPSPKLEQWWQYIAYGAAKKVFEDRTDYDSIAQIMPEYEKQEDLVNRRTEMQLKTKRTFSIYAYQVENNNIPSGWNGYGF
jgi:hypothetical protein